MIGHLARKRPSGLVVLANPCGAVRFVTWFTSLAINGFNYFFILTTYWYTIKYFVLENHEKILSWSSVVYVDADASLLL